MSFQLRRGGVIGGASIGALALVTAGAGLAGAQVSNPISVSPGTGAPGTTITVSGEDCDGTAVALLLAGDDSTIDTDEATVADGAWSGSLTADEELVEPGQTLTITATCLGGTMVYQSGSFVVSGVPPTIPSTTTSTTTSTTAPPSPPTTVAPPGDGPDPTTPTPTTAPPTPPTTAAPVPAPAPATPVDDNPDYAG